MASVKPIPSENERLPLLIGFQKVSDNTTALTSFVERGQGIYVYDTDGREYIEATASFYVAALGYSHAELIDAIEQQYRELPFFVSGLHRTSRTSLELAEKLTELVPVKDAHMLFASTGSEANDFLIKMLRFGAVARGEPQRKTIIGRYGSYHGGTLATASLTGGHHEEFGLPIEGFCHASQPDYHGERHPGESEAEYCARLAAELKTLIEARPDASIAAMVCEPTSFSAGLKVPTANYFPALCRVLDDYNIDFVVDEVITGIGRTGNMFGSETLKLKPDHAVLAKGITSGYFPLSAIALGADLYRDLEAGSELHGTLAHAGTFSAHPVAAAAALKVLEIIARENLVEHAAKMGERLLQKLVPLASHPLVGEIRHLGLAVSLDFLRRDGADVPINDAATADEIAQLALTALLERGVVGRAAGRSMLVAPPLIIKADEIDHLAACIAAALDDTLATMPAQLRP